MLPPVMSKSYTQTTITIAMPFNDRWEPNSQNTRHDQLEHKHFDLCKQAINGWCPVGGDYGLLPSLNSGKDGCHFTTGCSSNLLDNGFLQLRPQIVNTNSFHSSFIHKLTMRQEWEVNQMSHHTISHNITSIRVKSNQNIIVQIVHIHIWKFEITEKQSYYQIELVL